ncbi:MAG: cytochrome c maturation protein CcmE [Acidimicrobiales bacterium]
MELTPRTAPEPGAVAPRRPRNPVAYGVLLLVLIGIGVVAYQGLSSASLYFYNADEAVEQKADLGDRRFQLQGSVLNDVASTNDGVTFTVKFGGVEVPVRHGGDPPELFEPGIPVVLQGSWAPTGDEFLSDRILVKHSEEYEADNGGRIDDAEDADIDDSAAAQ